MTFLKVGCDRYVNLDQIVTFEIDEQTPADLIGQVVSGVSIRFKGEEADRLRRFLDAKDAGAGLATPGPVAEWHGQVTVGRLVDAPDPAEEGGLAGGN